MQNYREKLTINHLQCIGDFYESIKAEIVPARVKAVADYLTAGYKYVSKTEDDRFMKWDISMHNEMIHTLVLVTLDMNKAAEQTGLVMHIGDGKYVSLDPFFYYLESMDDRDFSEVIENLEELRDVLQNYLNETNIWAFKEVSDTVRLLHELMSNLRTN